MSSSNRFGSIGALAYREEQGMREFIKDKTIKYWPTLVLILEKIFLNNTYLHPAPPILNSLKYRGIFISG